MNATTLNAALTDICRQLLDEWELTPEQIANLAKDIPGECARMAVPSEDGWIEWKDGECPVAPDVRVKIKCLVDGVPYDRNGSDFAGWFDRLGWWAGKNERVRIIAWRPA